VLLPAGALLFLNLLALRKAGKVGERMARAGRWRVTVAAAVLVLCVAFYASRVSSPRIRLYMFVPFALESAGIALILWSSRLALLSFFLLLMLGLPVMGLESLLFHRHAYVDSLPDYGDLTGGKVTGSTKHPPGLHSGGLLTPNVHCRAKGASLWKTIRWDTNSTGFRNSAEIAVEKPQGVFRLMVLGDSFSVGCRLSQEETLPRMVEERLRAAGLKAEVINAHIEDPVIGCHYLEHFGFAFKPDAVLLAFCIGNDFLATDFHFAHRRQWSWVQNELDEAPRLRFSHIPSFSPPPNAKDIYPEYSNQLFPAEYVTGVRLPNLWVNKALYPRARQFALCLMWLSRRKMMNASPGWADGAVLPGFIPPHKQTHPMDITTCFGVFANGNIAEVDRAYGQTRKVLSHMKCLCEDNGVRLFLLAVPQGFQVYPTDWEANCLAYGLRSERFDLDRPNRWLEEKCRSLGIGYLDILEPMRAHSRSSRQRLYLRGGDMHWNPRGVALAARETADFTLRALRRKEKPPPAWGDER